MAYSIQYRQICSICQDEEKLISTRAESTSSTVQSNQKITIGKVLKCGHAFHTMCNNRHFFNYNKNCPTCRAPVADKDREFDITEDPAPPQGMHRYYSSQKNKAHIFMMPSRIPAEQRPEILERMKRFNEKAFGKDTENTHAPIPPAQPIFMDLNGVGHRNL